MLRGDNFVAETHYEILSVKEDASYEEIRTGYRSAILNSHPDKVRTLDPNNNLGNSFLKVQKAWEVLSDSKSRAIYDRELRVLRLDREATEDVALDDMMLDDAGELLEFFYQCRCGDYFSVDSLELSKMGYSLSRNGSEIALQTPDASPASFVLPCGSCSLRICLLINTNTKFSMDDQL